VMLDFNAVIIIVVVITVINLRYILRYDTEIALKN